MENRTKIPAVIAAFVAVGCWEEPEGECGDGVLAVVEAVTDADTLKVEGLGKIRLLGIDTPETHKTNPSDCPADWDEMSAADQEEFRESCCYGVQAKQMTAWLLPLGSTVCLVNPEGGDLEPDFYDRSLADVYMGETFLAGKLVAGGYARVYPEGSKFRHPTKGEDLDALQAAADSAGAGLWGYCYAQPEICTGK